MAGDGNVSAQTIGELIAGLEGVEKTCLRIEAAFNATCIRLEGTFKLEHDKVHSIVDALSNASRVNTSRLDAAIKHADHLEGRLDEAETLLEEYRTERDRRKGAAGVWNALYVALGGIITTGFLKAVEAFSATPKPPLPPHP